MNLNNKQKNEPKAKNVCFRHTWNDKSDRKMSIFPDSRLWEICQNIWMDKFHGIIRIYVSYFDWNVSNFI